MIDHIVTGRSMKKIRDKVNEIKELFSLNDILCFPLMKFYEHVIPLIFPEYRFLYVDAEELNGEEAYTDHFKKIVKVRTDVYERALVGSVSDLFTIAHEIGHLFLHRGESLAFARTKERFPAYKSAEWQANYFAAELLMSSHLILNMSVEEIAGRCCVSKSAASIQLDHAISELHKGKL